MPPDDSAFAEVNRDIALNHIGPRHDAFADSTRGLANTISLFADDQNSLAVTQAAFHKAMDAWMAIQHARLGPSQVEARAFRIQFWPDNRNRIGKQLDAVLTEERADLVYDSAVLANASVALQGMPALERLLFEKDLPPESYGRHLARAIAANIETIARELAVDWAPGGGWLEGLYEPGSSARAYPTAAQATSSLILAMTTQLESVVGKKLNAPLGAGKDNARPRLAESWRSGRSLRNVRLNLVALIDFFGHGEGRIRQLIENAGGAGIADAVSSALHSGLSTIAALPDGFGDSLADEGFRSQVISASGNLDQARTMVGRDAVPMLGLLLGFNSLDGD